MKTEWYETPDALRVMKATGFPLEDMPEDEQFAISSGHHGAIIESHWLKMLRDKGWGYRVCEECDKTSFCLRDPSWASSTFPQYNECEHWSSYHAPTYHEALTLAMLRVFCEDK